MKRWVNVELAKETASRFKEYCRDYHIKFETSNCFNMIHFECLMDDVEIAKANDFIAASGAMRLVALRDINLQDS